MTISDSTVTRNTALVSDGGGIANAGTLTIDGSTISGNAVLDTNPSSLGDGGGIENGGTLSINDSTISSNSTDGGLGGGIDNNAGTVMLTDSTVAGNSAGSGGGISNDPNATLTTISSTIADNLATIASSDGGGLYVSGGSASLYDTIVALNTARHDGQ